MQIHKETSNQVSICVDNIIHHNLKVKLPKTSMSFRDAEIYDFIKMINTVIKSSKLVSLSPANCEWEATTANNNVIKMENL